MPEATYLSQFYVTVEGLDDTTTVALLADVLEITVDSSLHLPDVATIILHDTGLRWIDEKRLEPGRGVIVSARPSDGPEERVFDGEIVELEPDFSPASQRLIIRAFDRLHRLGRGRRVRSFLNVTDGDLVQKIAAEMGLQAKVGPASPVSPYVFQNNETNLAFLRGRAAGLGYALYMDGKVLHFEPPHDPGDPIELVWADTLLEFRPRLTTLEQTTSSQVRGWDPATRQEIFGEARHGNGRPAIGESRDPGDLAQSAFQLDAPVLTADRPIRTQAAAEHLAQAVADRLSGRFVEAEGTSRGNPKLVAGASVKVANLGQRFSGTYLVTSARHRYSHDQGYATDFDVSGQEPASLLRTLTPEEPRALITGLVIGIVTDNHDPDGRGRVRVRYPWLAPDHASDWARLVAPGAGADRGIEFLPEINDEVLVGFELGDVHYPYIIGGLWNGQDAPPGKPDDVVNGGKVQQRIIRSRTGHTITLNDSDGAPGIAIEDRDGNRIALETASDALRIKVKGDAAIECDGSLTLEAKGQVTVRGTGITIDAGAGTVDVRGTTINLN